MYIYLYSHDAELSRHIENARQRTDVTICENKNGGPREIEVKNIYRLQTPMQFYSNTSL